MDVAVKNRAKLDVVPLTKHIGAEIRGIDLREKPDEDTVRAIYQAWLDHLVLTDDHPAQLVGHALVHAGELLGGA